MIHVNFNEPKTEKWKKWKRKCEREQLKYNASITQGENIKIKEKLYKECKNDVFLDPKGPFHGKCAYCEQKIYSDQHGDIEHFRPKSGVKDENNRPVLVSINGRAQEHPGYYWLVYRYENLLPSCVLCNQPSTEHSGGRTIGKHNRFPVAGIRATQPGEETLEDPLLLNPVFDNPEQHLEIDKTGVYGAKKSSVKGSMSIDILGLNDRDLPNERSKKYRDVKEKMQLLARAIADDTNSDDAKNLLCQIRDIKDGCDEYTFVARKAIEDSNENLMFVLKELGVKKW